MFLTFSCLYLSVKPAWIFAWKCSPLCILCGCMSCFLWVRSSWAQYYVSLAAGGQKINKKIHIYLPGLTLPIAAIKIYSYWSGYWFCRSAEDRKLPDVSGVTLQAIGALQLWWSSWGWNTSAKYDCSCCAMFQQRNQKQLVLWKKHKETTI